VGGLGLAPGANIGEDAAIYEAVHGTAPDIAGKGIANPIAAMLAGAMMLERVGQKERGVRLEAAVRRAIAKGKDLTPDLGGKGTTQTFTDRVIGELDASPAAER
jgi:isocitrate/isopropylmalate dehydrogenase